MNIPGVVYLFCCVILIFIMLFIFSLAKAAKNGDRMVKEAMKELSRQFNHEMDEDEEEIIII